MEFIKSKLDPIMITINDTEYPAKLTFKALAELEDLTKTSFMSLFDRMANGASTTKEITSILFVALKHGGVDVKFDDIQEMDFDADSFKNIMGEISNIMKRTQKVVSVIETKVEDSHAKKK